MRSSLPAVAPEVAAVTVYVTGPPLLATTASEACLASVTFACVLTDGRLPVTLPPMSVCFTCVPLAMYWTGATPAPPAAGPVGRDRDWAVYGRFGPLAPGR